ncbi:MAG: pilus assembly FimT family protein [Fimbriiglobus sp.]
MNRQSNLSARSGYTLVELLVVMSLIVLLAALAVGVANSGLIGSQKVISASDRVSGWLLISKQRALRDGALRGLRFYSSPGDATRYTECQYIESPEPWVPNPGQEGNTRGGRLMFIFEYSPAVPNTMSPSYNSHGIQWRPPFFTRAELYFVSNTLSDLDEYDQRVLTGDFVVIPELGKSLQIANPNAGVTPNTFYLIGGTQNLLLDTGNNRNCRRIELTSIPTPTQMAALVAAVPAPNSTGAAATLDSLLNKEPFRITGLDLSAAGTQDPATIAPAVPIRHPITMINYKFSFQAAPRPLLGEPTMQLPVGTAIDYRAGKFAPYTAPFSAALMDSQGYRTWSSPVNPPPPAIQTANVAPFNPPTTIGVTPIAESGTFYFDIMFSPSGQVVNNSSGLICLWVRDTTKPISHPRQFDTTGFSDCDGFDSAGVALPPEQRPYDNAGQQSLVVVYTRNGLIATQEVQPPPATRTVGYDPYLYAKDGINSGL